MAALQFLSKYRETGLLLIRASLGLIFIILIAPVLWNGSGSWEHFGDAMKHLDFHAHFKVWGFVGAVLGCAGGVLMILGLFFRIGVLFGLAVPLVHLLAVWEPRRFPCAHAGNRDVDLAFEPAVHRARQIQRR